MQMTARFPSRIKSKAATLKSSYLPFSDDPYSCEDEEKLPVLFWSSVEGIVVTIL